MNDLRKNEKIEKMVNDITVGEFPDIRNLAEITLEFHDRLTKLEAIANFTCLVESQDGIKPNIINQKPGESKIDFLKKVNELEFKITKGSPDFNKPEYLKTYAESRQRIENLPKTDPHLGMIDLEAFSKLQNENMKLREENARLAGMFWDEVKASLLWKQKYETSYNELRALKMAAK